MVVAALGGRGHVNYGLILQHAELIFFLFNESLQNDSLSSADKYLLTKVLNSLLFLK